MRYNTCTHFATVCVSDDILQKAMLGLMFHNIFVAGVCQGLVYCEQEFMKKKKQQMDAMLQQEQADKQAALKRQLAANKQFAKEQRQVQI